MSVAGTKVGAVLPLLSICRGPPGPLLAYWRLILLLIKPTARPGRAPGAGKPVPLLSAAWLKLGWMFTVDASYKLC